MYQTSPSLQEVGSGNNNKLTQTIECDVLFLTDSNLHKTKPEIMNHGSISQNKICPTFKDIEYVVSNSNITFKDIEYVVSNSNIIFKDIEYVVSNSNITFKDIEYVVSNSNITFKDIEYVVSNSNVINAEQINVEKVNFNLEPMGTRLGSIISELNRVLLAEDCEIILPRGEHRDKDNETNNLLHTTCRNYRSVKLMRNNKIS